MTQINWQYQVNNRAGGYVVTAGDWNDFAGNFRALIDQTTGSGTTDNSPLPIGIDLVNDRVYISDPDSTTPEDANHANTTLSVVGSSTFNGTVDMTAGVLQGGSPFVFEGATDNGYETTFAITDPTADRTITFKDGTGTVAFTSDITTTSPAGSDHDVQFNNSGSFGADSNFTYDGSAATLKATLTVGVNDTGHDVIFYGATADNAWLWWDESADDLLFGPASKVGIGTDATTPAATPLHVNNATPTFTISDTADNSADGDAQCTIHMAGRYHSGTANPLADAYSDVKLVSFKDSADGTGGAGFQIWSSADSTGGLTKHLEIGKDGKVVMNATANILSITDSSNANQSGYVGFYDDGTAGRLGYVGYPANDDLYIKQEDADGDLYIISENARIYLQASTYFFWSIGGTYEMRLDGTRLRPYTDKGLSLGDAAARWNVLYVNEIEADLGSASDPSYTFNGDENTGMYSTADVLRFSTGGSQRGLFSSSGLYAIKAVSTGTYAFWASSGYLVAFSSSIRFKENVANLPKSEWEKVYDLQAVSFDWKTDGTVEIDPNRGKEDHGFIAEDVEKILPKVVNYDALDHEDLSKGYQVQSVNYGELTPYLVEAIKDLKARIETLEG
jgi:hypothetical protein